MKVLEELKLDYDGDLHLEADCAVEEIFDSLMKQLASSSRTKRTLIYVELLRQAGEAMLVDGGPTFALKLFEDAAADMRTEEQLRGKKKIGPFLTPAQLRALAMCPSTRLEVSWDR